MGKCPPLSGKRRSLSVVSRRVNCHRSDYKDNDPLLVPWAARRGMQGIWVLVARPCRQAVQACVCVLFPLMSPATMFGYCHLRVEAVSLRDNYRTLCPLNWVTPLVHNHGRCRLFGPALSPWTGKKAGRFTLCNVPVGAGISSPDCIASASVSANLSTVFCNASTFCDNSATSPPLEEEPLSDSDDWLPLVLLSTPLVLWSAWDACVAPGLDR